MIKLIILLVVLTAITDFASAQVPFYQDKTITVVLGGPPAGSADLRTRAVTATLRRHISGNPNIIVQYMAAGGGRQAANHVYRIARPDGLTIGSMGAALVANAVLGEPGVEYDIDKLIYLGTPDSAVVRNTTTTGTMKWFPSVAAKTMAGLACSATAATQSSPSDKDL